MYIPRPSVQPLVVTQDINSFLKQFENIGDLVGGVAVYGSAAAYALVWELGSLRLKHPGPKTMWSTNREGERVILTKQAPHGYVGILEDSFWPIIQEELFNVDFTAPGLKLRLQVAIENASQRIARMIAEAAPVDSGDLRSQIQLVEPTDKSMIGQSTKLQSAGTLII